MSSPRRTFSWHGPLSAMTGSMISVDACRTRSTIARMLGSAPIPSAYRSGVPTSPERSGTDESRTDSNSSAGPWRSNTTRWIAPISRSQSTGAVTRCSSRRSSRAAMNSRRSVNGPLGDPNLG